ncbi:Protein kinase-like domain protein [Metarhizium rileyi]|uniref:non-specific serine/threonine protein kinase n=1 Tax=Metarhizium rileyi (strain RCEF 4871) TaxID=1649241 RepID=A0A166ZYE3_METRR|nr:Protein kinase-like domain protein [Metarhizium rileyi RCEF 4871]TWU73337.1 hypothetical protein ED733_004841 [Metarhizium rileyi]
MSPTQEAADTSARRPRDLRDSHEPFELYRTDGYCPIILHQLLNQRRYQVIAKLGWDLWSTTWFALDIAPEDGHTFVAIRIFTAEKSQTLASNLEVQCLHKALYDATLAVPFLIETFSHQSRNGLHRCFVTDIYGPTLKSVVSEYSGRRGNGLRVDVIFMVAEQLLEAIAKIHEAGYGHGDIRCANIAFTLSTACRRNVHALLQVIGTPSFSDITGPNDEPLTPSLPTQAVLKSHFNWFEEEIENIRLINSFEAFTIEKRPISSSQLLTSLEYHAPELLFTGGCDEKIDLWCAGIVIYNTIFSDGPFKNINSQVMLIEQMIGFMEDLPEV